MNVPKPKKGAAVADFKLALEFVLRHEGAYIDDSHDPGGETYKGVSRKHHPGWDGWKIIDRLREKEDFPGILSANPALQNLLVRFYEVEFWRRLDGHRLSEQSLAEELFETAVNLGPGRAVKFLQRSLNALNRSESVCGDLREDGSFGEKTRRSLSAYLSNDSPEILLTCLNILQGMHYLNRLKERPDQKRFARGWLARVTIIKAPAKAPDRLL